MHLFTRLVAVACLCLMTYASAWAENAVVTLVVPDSGAVYREVADVLKAEVGRLQPDRVQWHVVTPAQLESLAISPRMVVTIGSAALDAAAKHRAKVGAGETAPALLATLLPRLAFDRAIAQAPNRKNITAILLDQPVGRQAALIRAALPNVKRVGVLLGPESKSGAAALRNALADQGLIPQIEDISGRGLFAAVQDVLDQSDVLLAVADPAVFSGETISSILMAGYRRQVPLIGFSPSYVKSGALIGLYATPAQIARATANVVRDVLSGGPLPSPAVPLEFTVDINSAVARSLGLSLDEQDILKRMLSPGVRP
jgi:putative ABC transport system substrate-binding protein